MSSVYVLTGGGLHICSTISPYIKSTTGFINRDPELLTHYRFVSVWNLPRSVCTQGRHVRLIQQGILREALQAGDRENRSRWR